MIHSALQVDAQKYVINLAQTRGVENQSDRLLNLLEAVEKCSDIHARIHRAQGDRWAGAIPTAEPVSTVRPIQRTRHPLTAVDGSQVFPMPESPAPWSYVQAVAYTIGAAPRLFWRFYGMGDMNIYPDDYKGIVSGWRSLLEMEAAAAVSSVDRLVLLDGELLPWLSASIPMLEGETAHYRDLLLSTRPNLVAAVTSSPRSCLISRLCSLAVDHEVIFPDLALMSMILRPGSRSAIFLHGSPRNALFVEKQAGIYFFFLRINDKEIARVEIPEWVAADPAATDLVAGAILEDSSFTGYSYALSQAHHSVIIPAETARELQENTNACYYARTGTAPLMSAKDQAKNA